MSIFDRLFRPAAQKESQAVGGVLTLVTPNQPVWRLHDYESYANEGYKGNPYVYRAVEYIAWSCAGVPWVVHKAGSTEREDSTDQHPVLDLLRRPNPYAGRARFIHDMFVYLLIAGDAYIERVGPNNTSRPPLELYNLRPDRMKVLPGNAFSRVGGYQYEAGAYKKTFPPELIRHLTMFDPLSDWYGMPPLKAADKSVDQNNDSRTWNVALLQNGARPSGALLSEGNLSETAQKQIKAQIDERHSGPRNAGRWMVLDGGLKWQEMSISPKDMEWLEGQKLSAREIAICYAVPPELLGDGSNKTYSNYQEARRAFYQETCLPLLDYLRDELNAWLTPLYGTGFYLDYNSDEIEALQEDRDKLFTRAQGVYRDGLATRNEARQMIGLPPDTTDPESDAFRKAGISLPSLGTDDNDENTDEEKPEPPDPEKSKAACGCGHTHEIKAQDLTPREMHMARDIEAVFRKQYDDVLAKFEAQYGA